MSFLYAKFGKAVIAGEVAVLGGTYYIYHNLTTDAAYREKMQEHMPWFMDAFHAATKDSYRVTALASALDLAASVGFVPYGVLGQQLSAAGKFVPGVGRDPLEIPGCVIVDPAGLHHVQPPGGPKGAGGAAGAIYKWLGIHQDARFPEDVIAAVKATSDAKYHAYPVAGKGPGGGGGAATAHVIHTVGPDFRRLHEPAGTPPYTRAEAVAALTRSYEGIFREFAACGQPGPLRLLPVSGGIFAGPFAAEVPALTREAVGRGLAALSPEDRARVVAGPVDLCIFAAADLPRFEAAGFRPAIEAGPGGGGGGTVVAATSGKASSGGCPLGFGGKAEAGAAPSKCPINLTKCPFGFGEKTK